MRTIRNEDLVVRTVVQTDDLQFERDEFGKVLIDELTGLAVVPPVIGE